VSDIRLPRTVNYNSYCYKKTCHILFSESPTERWPMLKYCTMWFFQVESSNQQCINTEYCRLIPIALHGYFLPLFIYRRPSCRIRHLRNYVWDLNNDDIISKDDRKY
jgi:hypothetical protein